MAPPTPVLSRVEIFEKYKVEKVLSGECTLRSLTQNECTYNGLEYICLPFKRVFQECMLKSGRVMRVEVTDELTNNPLKMFKDEVDRFLKADAELQMRMLDSE